MNREIKFRVWNKKENRWINSGNFLICPDGSFVWGRSSSLIVDDKENIIQQFTGFKDKNGKEIYEGDIVKVFMKRNDVGGKEGSFRIEYYNGSFWAGGLNCLSMYILRGQIFEVIGNVFENPDLCNKPINN